jgi:hypothetical protein
MTIKEFDIVSDIRTEIWQAKEDGNRRKITKWLSRLLPVPSKEHNRARDKHEATTGSWFLQSEDFKSWLRCPNSLIWLHGGGMWPTKIFPILSSTDDMIISWCRKVNSLV